MMLMRQGTGADRSGSVRPILWIAAACLSAGVVSGARGQELVWSLRSDSGPSPRGYTALAYDSDRGVTVMFGGFSGVYNGDTWEWDGTRWTLRAVAGPSPRSNHAMAYDQVRRVVVLFGGIGAAGSNGETWQWDGAAWTQRAVPGPPARNSHAMAFDSARGATVLFGGDVGNGSPSGQTWEWDGQAWTQRAVAGPAPRYYHGMAFDAARGRTVQFGGRNGGSDLSSYSGETWVAAGGAWTLAASTAPSRRAYHAMCYDAARARTVLFGGFTGASTESDTWVWDGSAWSQLAIVGPSYRYTHAMAYDAGRAAVVMFGGRGAPGQLGETWELRCAHASVTPDRPVVCPSTERVGFGMQVVGPGPFTYRWQLRTGPGAWADLGTTPTPLPCGGSADALGADTPAAGIGVRPCPGDPTRPQRYAVRCVLTNACGSITSAEAVYTVCPADYTCANGVDLLDVFAFLADWFAAAPRADFDGVGGVDILDVFRFLAAWFDGCA